MAFASRYFVVKRGEICYVSDTKYLNPITMNLHKEFVRTAFDINKMKNRLMSLLLEIYEKEIYREYGCETIFEYGFKFARLSRETVLKAIRTLKHLEGKPFLKKAVITQGIHKVAMVATIAKPETDKVFAEHVENMSKSALFEFAKEIRAEKVREGGEGARGGEGAEGGERKKCLAVPMKVSIALDQEAQILFFRLKNKFAKGLCHERAMKVILKKMEETISRKDVPGNGISKKNEVDKPVEGVAGKKGKAENFPSRYVPVKIKKRILAKYGDKCAYPGCVKAVETIHHKVPFAFMRSHDSATPLCRVHHEFAHNGVISRELGEPDEWRLNVEGGKSVYDRFCLMKK